MTNKTDQVGLKEEICECGHEARHHLIDLDTNNLYRDCGVPSCSCKKFNPKKELIK